MNKRLIVFGDSMTYGHGMPDADNLHFKQPSEKTWANTVANHYNLELVNKAIPGSGNDSILRNFHDYIIGHNNIDNYNYQDRFKVTYNPGDIVIIGLSMLFRMELHFHNHYLRLILNSEYKPDKKIYESFQYLISNISEKSLLIKMIQDIHTIQCICNTYNIPYIVFHSIPPIQASYPNIINNEYLKVQGVPSTILFEKDNWIREAMHCYIANKLGLNAFLPCSHPNEIGHKFWGEYIIRYIESIGLLK